MVGLVNCFSSLRVPYCEHPVCVLSLSTRKGYQTPESVLNFFINSYSWFAVTFFLSNYSKYEL